MHDQPDPVALLERAARTIREDLLANLSGAAAYQARIAASVIALVSRQLVNESADDATELERLQAILEIDGELATLNRELTRRIAAREISIDRADVLDHLWSTTIAKVKVDQPTFPGLDRQSVRQRL